MERAKSDRLLLNILPSAIAEELKSEDRVQPRFYDSVTILFVDFKEFTRLTESIEPAALVQQLDQHFPQFDEIVAQYRPAKLKRYEGRRGGKGVASTCKT